MNTAMERLAMNDMTLDQRMAQVSRRTAAAQARTARQQHLDDLYWTAYRAAQYRQGGVNEIPAGLDAGEREAYDAGLAGGDADRRQA